MNFLIGGWGGENEVAPTGKSFRFVRACERAGGRRARDQLRLPRGICRMIVVAAAARRPLCCQKVMIISRVF